MRCRLYKLKKLWQPVKPIQGRHVCVAEKEKEPL
jgi:hypothetical protein